MRIHIPPEKLILGKPRNQQDLRRKRPDNFSFLNLISITKKLPFSLFCESSSDLENVWDFVEKIFVS
jgi:hypothetical protein